MADQSDLLAIQAMNGLPDNRRAEFQVAFQGMKKNRTTALVLSLLLGHLGVDRFYLGQTALGLLKLFTCGGADEGVPEVGLDEHPLLGRESPAARLQPKKPDRRVTAPLIWWFVDLFIIMASADKKNAESLYQLQAMYRR